jgi:hypothetical protein
MRAVAAAAGGQAGVIVPQGRGQGAEQEEAQEQKGNAAPHMELSVQERVAGWDGREKAKHAFSYHQRNAGVAQRNYGELRGIA